MARIADKPCTFTEVGSFPFVEHSIDGKLFAR
jgi:hypothetical protein